MKLKPGVWIGPRCRKEMEFKKTGETCCCVLRSPLQNYSNPFKQLRLNPNPLAQEIQCMKAESLKVTTSTVINKRTHTDLLQTPQRSVGGTPSGKGGGLGKLLEGYFSLPRMNLGIGCFILETICPSRSGVTFILLKEMTNDISSCDCSTLGTASSAKSSQKET